MTIYEAINGLLQYGEMKNIYESDDKEYILNSLLAVFNLDDYKKNDYICNVRLKTNDLNSRAERITLATKIMKANMNIDDLIKELHLIEGMTIKFGNGCHFHTCHFSIKKDKFKILGFKEGWIRSIKIYNEEISYETSIFPTIEKRIEIIIGIKTSAIKVPAYWTYPEIEVGCLFFEEYVENISLF